MEIILFGIATSLFQEAVNFIEGKFNKTSLSGKGAVVLSLVLAFFTAVVSIGLSGVAITSINDIFAVASQVWTASQIWFLFYERFAPRRLQAD